MPALVAATSGGDFSYIRGVASSAGKAREATCSYFSLIRPTEGSDVKTADEVKVRLQDKIEPAEAGWQIANYRKRGSDRVKFLRPVWSRNGF